MLRTSFVLSIAMLFVIPALPAASQDDPNTLVFVVRGLRNDVGVVGGGIYSDPHVWTREGGQVATCHAPIHGGVARCVIRAPGPGRYAFAFVHDEDNNGRMRMDAIGIPQEGYGFGNDARGGLGAPSFESASVVLPAGGHVEQTVTTRYGISL